MKKAPEIRGLFYRFKHMAINARSFYPNLPVLEEFRMCAPVVVMGWSIPTYRPTRSMGCSR